MRYNTLMAAVAMLAATGCSTIIEGKSQNIAINTTPPKASCELTRKEVELGKVDPTPGSITVEKTKDDLTIACKKKGYEETTFIDKSGSAGATFGNIAAGGFIGWGVDSATGADNKYDSPVNITLTKK